MTTPVHIIIVTHNSEDVLPICLSHIDQQTYPVSSIIIVDSGSESTAYLDTLQPSKIIRIIKTENRGFSSGNNLGFREIDSRSGVVIFLNPDAFLSTDYIRNAISLLDTNSLAAIVSGKLLGYDAQKNRATGKIDSTGIFRKWYGRWYDRGIGEEDCHRYDCSDTPLAVCGALMFCRMEALQKYDGQVFDEEFFLYKEDIELSLRLRRDGWQLLYDPDLIAYHCRGWKPKRKNIPFETRLIAAKNEVLLYQKHPSPYILWAILKLLLVKIARA